MLNESAIFVADTHVNPEPTGPQIAEIAIGAARHVRRFGLTPRVALCSHSQFGNLDTESGRRMREAIRILDETGVDFIYEGEMNSDAALNPKLRERIFPNSRLKGAANVLIFANVDAASGVRNMLKIVAGSLEVGPILMGMGNKAHIVTPSISARGLLNTSALAGTSCEELRLIQQFLPLTTENGTETSVPFRYIFANCKMGQSCHFAKQFGNFNGLLIMIYSLLTFFGRRVYCM